MGGASMDGTDPFEGSIKEVEGWGDDKNYLVLLLMLPDVATPGTWMAVTAWSEIFAEVRKRYPNRQFQFLPHTYDDKYGSRLESILAVSI